MKKYILSVAAASILVLACHRKTAPVISSRTEFPEPPKSTQSAVTPATPEFLAAGKAIYESRCIRCHDLKAPDVYTGERWTTILQSMIPKARLNDEESKQVTEYVMANAKK